MTKKYLADFLVAVCEEITDSHIFILAQIQIQASNQEPDPFSSIACLKLIPEIQNSSV
jgi:hypothetical protein